MRCHIRKEVIKLKKKQFKSESKRLLDLMINSIYTHKEIFLRELISNASDAIDKLCFIALTDDKLGMTRSDFKINIFADKDARTLTITDNGIGMDREDLENNLGTIASSGSYKFTQGSTAVKRASAGSRAERTAIRSRSLRKRISAPRSSSSSRITPRTRATTNSSTSTASNLSSKNTPTISAIRS